MFEVEEGEIEIQEEIQNFSEGKSEHISVDHLSLGVQNLHIRVL